MKQYDDRPMVAVMGDLFRVWKDTPNADDILSDVCNTISYQLLKYDAAKRGEFLAACREAGDT